MAAAPELRIADQLARPVMALLLESEQVMLERMAKSLAHGIDAPDWQQRKLLELQLLQSGLRRDLSAAEKVVQGEVARSLVGAYNLGSAAATRQLDASVGEAGARAALGNLQAGLPAIESLYADTVTSLRPVYARVLREFDDEYRAVVRDVAGHALTGAMTRREVGQAALDRFAARGVTGFVDRSGRSWQLSSYVEMATRSAVARAAVDGQTDRLQAAGRDLVYVSNSPEECDKCRPWEGRVLSLSGTVAHPGVDVAGTLEQAKAAGLMHPGCTHSVSLYLPGITRLPDHGEAANPDGYRDRERLRYLERQVRASKRMEAAAMDPAAARKARARAAYYRRQIEQHVSTSTAKRQRWREQLQAGRPGRGGLGPIPQADTPAPPTPVGPAGLADDTADLASDAATAARRDLSGNSYQDDIALLDNADLIADLTDDDLDELAARLMAADDWEAADRVAELMDARYQQAAGDLPAQPKVWQPDPDEPFNPATYEWFEELSDDEQYAFVDRLDRRTVDDFYLYQYAHVTGGDVAKLERAAIPPEREIRAQWEVWIETEWERMEALTNGQMLKPKYREQGLDINDHRKTISTRDLWRVNWNTAKAWASEEVLREWDRIGGRMTYARFKAGYTGQAGSTDAWRGFAL